MPRFRDNNPNGRLSDDFGYRAPGESCAAAGGFGTTASTDVSEASQLISLTGISIPGLSLFSTGFGMEQTIATNPCVSHNVGAFIAGKIITSLLSFSGMPMTLFNTLGFGGMFACKAGRQNIAASLAQAFELYKGGTADFYMGMTIATNITKSKYVEREKISNASISPAAEIIAAINQTATDDFALQTLNGSETLIDYTTAEATAQRLTYAYRIISFMGSGASTATAVRRANPTGCASATSTGYCEFNPSVLPAGSDISALTDNVIDNFSTYGTISPTGAVTAQTPPAGSTAVEQQGYAKYAATATAVGGLLADIDVTKEPVYYPGELELGFIVNLFFQHFLKATIAIKAPSAFSQCAPSFQSLSDGSEIDYSGSTIAAVASAVGSGTLPMATAAAGLAFYLYKKHKQAKQVRP